MQTKELNQTLPSLFTSQYLNRLASLKLVSRRKFLTGRQGGHYSLKRGHGIEFADYRKYELGDDPRRIDHRLLARSERVYIKRFAEEQDLIVHIIIDTSASLIDFPEKLSFVKNLALSIAYLSSMQNDRLQLSLPGVLPAKKYFGKSIIYKLNNDLAEYTGKAVEDYSLAIKESIAATKFPGVAYYISDFLEPIENIKSTIQGFVGKNLDLRLVQVLSEQEVEPDITNTKAIDAETGRSVSLSLNKDSLLEYQALLKQHNKSVEGFAQKNNVLWHSYKTTDSIIDKMEEVI